MNVFSTPQANETLPWISSSISLQLLLSFCTILWSRNPLKSSLRKCFEVLKWNSTRCSPQSSHIHLHALHGWKDLTTPHSCLHCVSLTCLVFTCNCIPSSDEGLYPAASHHSVEKTLTMISNSAIGFHWETYACSNPPRSTKTCQRY